MTADATTPPTIFLVDDDRPVLKAQARLLREHGLQTVLFESAEDFLLQHDASVPGCLVLDVNLPGLDGLELQRRLAEIGSSLPIVFLTALQVLPSDRPEQRRPRRRIPLPSEPLPQGVPRGR